MTERLDRLTAWTQERFPVDSLAYHWSAQDNSSTDRVPYIGRLHPGTSHVYVATGFNAWGMTNGVLAGRLLAALLNGEDPPWSRLYDPRRLHPTIEAVPLVKAAVDVARKFVGDRIRPATFADSPDELARGDGAVIRIAGQRCAVYRDDSGQLHTVGATCTHLGCVVAFNDDEKTWDCPCHGSRFDTQGGVLHGPATKPLPPYPTPAGRPTSDHAEQK